MSFFGVSSNLINCGTPSTSQQSESCDMTPYQAVLLSREVRMRGITAAQQTYYRLQYEYSNVYAAYQQLQAEAAEKSAAIESYFEGKEKAVRDVCEKAAQARVVQIQEGGSDYTHPKYAALVAGLREDHRNAVDELLVPYYTIAHELENAENALWAKHSLLTASQEVHVLWTVELNAAEWQLQTMPADTMQSADRNIAELRHLAQRVAEIRKKRLLKRKRDKTVARHLGTQEAETTNVRRAPMPQAQYLPPIALTIPESGVRASSAPPSARSSSARSSTNAHHKGKRVDFDAIPLPSVESRRGPQRRGCLQTEGLARVSKAYFAASMHIPSNRAAARIPARILSEKCSICTAVADSVTITAARPPQMAKLAAWFFCGLLKVDAYRVERSLSSICPTTLSSRSPIHPLYGTGTALGVKGQCEPGKEFKKWKTRVSARNSSPDRLLPCSSSYGNGTENCGLERDLILVGMRKKAQKKTTKPAA
ncbi:uncharacterized protein LOC34622751 [Cyclospora cayetanensis]|uniref:Uncharacterized protein LOC34622751 n=1 Tax=Cyclospora cayetanensis TaxID=88456 RepID=A0A6P6S122_9EIME|nr:uncharacterized protein LOC34622751 [Cyclospora cayetanensis]